MIVDSCLQYGGIKRDVVPWDILRTNHASSKLPYLVPPVLCSYPINLIKELGLNTLNATIASKDAFSATKLVSLLIPVGDTEDEIRRYAMTHTESSSSKLLYLVHPVPHSG